MGKEKQTINKQTKEGKQGSKQTRNPTSIRSSILGIPFEVPRAAAPGASSQRAMQRTAWLARGTPGVGINELLGFYKILRGVCFVLL